MKKIEKMEIISNAIGSKQLLRFFMKYDVNYFYYFPLKISDKLFMGIEEDDFILDGYSIRKNSDIRKIVRKDDLCNKIFIEEGIVSKIETIDINITNWRTVFDSLLKFNEIIIIESEDIEPEFSEFTIGKIIKVSKNNVHFKDFDADGVWSENELVIPFSSITSVTLRSRYINVWSKYV